MTSDLNSVVPKFRTTQRVLKCKNSEISSFLSRWINNAKLRSVFKNQPPKWITKGDMRIFPLFCLIFQVILWKKTSILRCIDQWQMRIGERGRGINKIPFRVPKDKKYIFEPCHVFILIFYFFPQTLNSFTLLDTDQNRYNSVNRLSLAAD